MDMKDARIGLILGGLLAQQVVPELIPYLTDRKPDTP